MLGSDRLIHPALQGKPVAWFAPSYRLLSEAWRELSELLRPVTKESNKQERRIDLIGGGTLEAWSLDSPDAGRGRKYAAVVVDEAAMVTELENAWTQAIRPTLTDLKGDAWFLSTPKGINNHFYSLFRRGQDAEFPEWMSWSMPSVENPLLDPVEIEAARADLSELSFAQEYEAKFVSWSGAVFRSILPAIWEVPEWLQSPALADPMQRIRWSLRRPLVYAIGVDWARTNDYTVFTVVCNDSQGDPVPDESGRMEQPFGVVEIDRFRGMEYSLQRARLHALWERYGRCQVLVESNSIGGPQLEQLVRDGMHVKGFTTTNATKASIIEDLALAFERRTIRIPNYPPLIGELQAFEAQQLPSGLTRYSAPDGEHDDCVMSVALAYRCLKTWARRYDPVRIAEFKAFVQALIPGT